MVWAADSIDLLLIPSIFRKIESLNSVLSTNPLMNHDSLKPIYDKFDEKVKLNNELRLLEQKLEAQKHLVMRDDLRAMRRVLRKLEYVDDKDVVTVKVSSGIVTVRCKGCRVCPMWCYNPETLNANLVSYKLR